jgi:hypothetical protein
VYLTELPSVFAEVLAGLIESEATLMMQRHAAVDAAAQLIPQSTGDDLEVWEHRLETQIEMSPLFKETEKQALIRARRGQGPFRERVAAIESRCRTTSLAFGLYEFNLAESLRRNLPLATRCRPAGLKNALKQCGCA